MPVGLATRLPLSIFSVGSVESEGSVTSRIVPFSQMRMHGNNTTEMNSEKPSSLKKVSSVTVVDSYYYHIKQAS